MKFTPIEHSVGIVDDFVFDEVLHPPCMEIGCDDPRYMKGRCKYHHDLAWYKDGQPKYRGPRRDDEG